VRSSRWSSHSLSACGAAQKSDSKESKETKAEAKADDDDGASPRPAYLPSHV
jgi:hypothetical protein